MSRRSTTGGHALRDADGSTFWFDAGSACLDFAHSGGMRGPGAHESLRDPADLADWLASSRLAARPTTPPSGPELAWSKALRDAIRASAVRLAAGQRPRSRDVELLNHAARTPPLVPRIDAGRMVRRWEEPISTAQAMSALAREAVELLTGPVADRVRRCAAPDCSLVFVDTSRAGRRRWCAMERCGNRAKVRSFRDRRRVAAPAGPALTSG